MVPVRNTSSSLGHLAIRTLNGRFAVSRSFTTGKKTFPSSRLLETVLLPQIVVA